MKIGFTGTQTGTTDPQLESLIEIIEGLDIEEAHHGDCIGADNEFSVIIEAVHPKTELHCHPPTDGRKRAFTRYQVSYLEKPFLLRNQDIVNATDLMIACPKRMKEELRSGTWATVRYARKKNVPLVIIWMDGTCTYEYKDR